LPSDVQVQFIHSVPGLERARLTRYGYAIEYDYYPPEQLKPSLETKAIEGLFLAGQVNGTTGYEEAGGQGLLAGINALAWARGEEPVVLGRDDAYIGVLIDDLVTRGVDEPYRLFTSRAEYRLLLRQDNALKRVGTLARELKLLLPEEEAVLGQRLAEAEDVIDLAANTVAQPGVVSGLLREAGESELSAPQRVSDLVRRPRLGLKTILNVLLAEDLPEYNEDAWMSAEIELKYAGYLERERVGVVQLRELAAFRLPEDLRYLELDSISTEARQKLETIRPESLAQAGRIPGVSPSDLQNLVVEVLKHGKTTA